MLSSWKDIAVFLDGTPDGEKIGRHAAALARRHGAHLAGVYGVLRTSPGHPSQGYARGDRAIQQVIGRLRAADEQKVLDAGRSFSDLCYEYDIESEFRIVWCDAARDVTVPQAFHCDLIVSAHPKPHDLPDGWSAERLLLTSGTPVLLVPNSWRAEPIGDAVLIAWNASREARRAVSDAMPFIGPAGSVTVLIVDGDRDPARFGEDPGADILEHLARHGADAEIQKVASQGAPIAEVILSQAAERGANLLVIGAYSHPRTAEMLFGGVTRSLLSHSELPLLISR
jgi:nucleotide-binding universal stress UspA family protein